jgi:Cu-Zn family superoxide dismutase
MNFRLFLLLVLSAPVIAGICFCNRAPVTSAVSMLTDEAGIAVGVVNFSEMEGRPGVQILIRAWRLPPGLHGVHFEPGTSCDPATFRARGTHFNPFGRKHGLENPDGPHAGDLPNLNVPASGTVEVTIEAPLVTIGPGKNGLLRSALAPGGTCLVITERPDDGRSDPDGASGPKIAGGRIWTFEPHAEEDDRP